MIIEDAIHIAASPNVVWAVTEDVERWPEWTPTVTSVKRVSGGPFGLGSVARIKQPLQPASEWTVVAFERGQRFAWATRRRGLRMTGTHEVSSEGTGTKSVLRVEAAGALLALLGPLLRPLMRRALSDENRSLKARCEAITRADSAAPLTPEQP